MSQNDLTIANQGFASFRSDLNSALQALGSTNSGTSAPSTTFANQLFYDTTNNILKIRNEDNDAFISLFTLDQTNDNIEALTIDGTLTYTGDLVSSTAGTSNFRAGVNAGNSITSGGNYNTVVGDEAGTALTTGDNNTAIGFEALTTEDANGFNTAVGFRALKTLNAGSNGYNTALGYETGKSLTTGVQNVLLGATSGDALTDADFNVAIGVEALGSDTKGNNTVAIGYASLFDQNFTTPTDANNTAVGHLAGTNVTTGIQNTLIGSLAGDALTDADFNTAIGYASLTNDTKGSKSIAIGAFALQSQNFTSATDSHNTAIGLEAGGAVTTGVQNVFVGNLSGDATDDGSFNTALGYASLSANCGDLNTAIGYASGVSLTGATNTLVGSNAGFALQNAADNVAVGASALQGETGGQNNVAIGKNALLVQANSSGNIYNTAVGSQAGKAMTTGIENTLIGGLAGDAMTTGDSNVGVGQNSIGGGVVTGNNNTAVGTASGFALTSGSNNLLLGHDSGRSGSPGGELQGSNNQIVLGDESIQGFHAQVSLTVASDQRDKTDFTALDIGLDFVNKLTPYTYKWDKRSKYGDKTEDDYDLNTQTPDGTHKEDWLDIGFKAQEVETLEVAEGYKKENKTNLLVTMTEDGKQYGMKYEKFVPILVKALQELSAKNDALEARIKTLEG